MDKLPLNSSLYQGIDITNIYTTEIDLTKQTNTYITLLYYRYCGENCYYTMRTGKQIVTFFSESNFSRISECAWHQIDKRTWNKYTQHFDKLNRLIVEDGISMIPSELFDLLREYMDLKQLSFKEKNTYCRVWTYLLYNICRYSAGHFTKTIKDMARECGMRENTFHSVLLRLCDAELIIRYGSFNFTTEDSHGYSYSLDKQFLDLLDINNKDITIVK